MIDKHFLLHLIFAILFATFISLHPSPNATSKKKIFATNTFRDIGRHFATYTFRDKYIMLHIL